MLRGLSNPNESVQGLCALQLGDLHEDSAVPPLCRLAQGKDKNLAIDCLSALLKINDNRAAVTYRYILTKSPMLYDSNIRGGSAEAIAMNGIRKLDDKSASPIMVQWLSSPKMFVNAAEALGDIGNSQDVRPLRRRLEQLKRSVRGADLSEKQLIESEIRSFDKAISQASARKKYFSIGT